ncbi:hypothetical protein MPSEU_000843200 [Mayamaea pseudoterrestris]|nr:hypothetical protein MPSEU_000843200 [Mayamaea pseudoterrestris]
MRVVLASSLFGALSVTAFQVSLPSRSVLSNTRSASPFMVSQLSSESYLDGLEASTAEDAETAAVASSDDGAAKSETSTKKVERERHTIFIGNMDFDVSEADIKEMVSKHVDVKLVSLPRDKLNNNPRGFCFVDVGSEEQIDQAITALDGSEFSGRTIRVKRSVPKDQVEKKVPEVPQVPEGYSRLYVANLPFEATKEELVEFFQTYGDVSEVYIPMNRNKNINKGYAFVTMKNEDVSTTLEKASGVAFQGRELIVNQSLAPGEKAARREKGPNKLCKLFVGNLSFYTIEETLVELFEEFGEVVDCYLPKDMDRGGNTSRGFGFVTMARDSALTAMSELDGCEIDGRNIQINEAQAKARREKTEEF